MWDRLFWDDKPAFPEDEIRLQAYVSVLGLLLVVPLLPFAQSHDPGPKFVLAVVGTIVGQLILRKWARLRGLPFVSAAEARHRFQVAQRPWPHRLFLTVLIGLGVAELFSGRYPWQFHEGECAIGAVVAVTMSCLLRRMARSASSAPPTPLVS